jgi:hypothetical protein
VKAAWSGSASRPRGFDAARQPDAGTGGGNDTIKAASRPGDAEHLPDSGGSCRYKGFGHQSSAQDCLGFTVKDAAPFLGVSVAQVTLPKAKTDQIKLAQAVVAKL